MNHDYTAHYAAITADMQYAATLPLHRLAGYLANYGARLRTLADACEYPDVAFRQLSLHADRAYAAACAERGAA